MLDVDKARADTPACADLIHLNNAGAALSPRPVTEAVLGHLAAEQSLGGYEAAEQAADKLAATYDALAALLGAERDEIAVVENATRAWEMVAYAMPLGPGDRIVTAVAEYGSNYLGLLQIAKRTGATIEVVPDDPDGQVDLAALGALLERPTKLVALTHMPTNGGLVNPAGAVGRLAREAGVPLLLDACQTVGQMPISVNDLRCDFLVGTARKFLRGPRGAGFLYVRRPWIEQLVPPFLDIHAATWTGHDSYDIRKDARRFETWECGVSAKIGLGVAATYARKVGLDEIRTYTWRLAGRLRQRLAGIPGVHVGDKGKVRGALVTFWADWAEPRAIVEHLRRRRINTDVTSMTSTRLDMHARGLPAMVRASPHYYNTTDEIDRLVNELARMA